MKSVNSFLESCARHRRAVARNSSSGRSSRTVAVFLSARFADTRVRTFCERRERERERERERGQQEREKKFMYTSIYVCGCARREILWCSLPYSLLCFRSFLFLISVNFFEKMSGSGKVYFFFFFFFVVIFASARKKEIMFKVAL